MNKYKIYMVISIIILIISIGTSLAWYVWSSTNNALVNLDVCTPTISFDYPIEPLNSPMYNPDHTLPHTQ